MRALNENEWLSIAKSLPIGSHVRVNHRGERRNNLVIGNAQDCWWAYCQACKLPGKVMKTHVILTDAPSKKEELSIATDLRPVQPSDKDVLKFLYSKGMALEYLPKVFISPSTHRLYLQDEIGAMHSRALYEGSAAKWLHFTSKSAGEVGDVTVITEDLFSMYKVRYAVQDFKDVRVYSTLGAHVKDYDVVQLMQSKHLIWMYDADTAGDAGSTDAQKRMRVHAQKQSRARPPEGLDPKDMYVQDIKDLIHNCIL